MAIQVQGTTVIDDSRNITNVNTIVNPRLVGSKETKIELAANNIDLSLGDYFTKTVTTDTTFTVSNVAFSGTAVSFIFDITNGGGKVITWWSGVKWAGGVAPTLTSSGRDVLSFFTHDGGTNWNGFVLGRDVK